MNLENVRTLFRDGERLTAARLNAAFAHAHVTLRRTLVGPLSPGVAVGLTLREENKGGSFAIDPGIAIDRRGRVVVVTALLRYTRSDLENVVGPLGDGDVVRVGIRVAGATSTDPCGPSPGDETERAEVVLRRITPLPGAPLLPIPIGPYTLLFPALLLPLFGATVNVGTSCTPPWGDLDASTNDPDGCSVQLGTVSADLVTKIFPSMDDRQGIAPRFDALRNSFEQLVIELRTRGGAPRVNFVAPAGGPDVQATRLAYAHSPVAAARVSPSDGGVAEVAGGVAPRAALPGGLPAGIGGLLTMPLALQPDTGSVSVGTVLEVYRPSSGDPAPVAPGAVRAMTDPSRAIGLMGAPSYEQTPGSGGSPILVAPIALAGLLRVQVDPGGDIGFEAGQPLAPLTASTLRVAGAPTDMVVAIAAEAAAATSAVPVYVFPVHPPRRLGS